MIEEIHVSIVPRSWIPNGQADDYREQDDGLHIQVGQTGNRLHNELLVVHALVEWMIAREQGVSIEQVDKWDEEHPDATEPGDIAECPYRDGHSVAVAVERIILAAVGKSWLEFDQELTRDL